MQHNWEIWLDSNLSPIIAKWMAEETGWNVRSSYILGHSSLDDVSVYLKAKEQGNIILISKDSDFPDLISRSGAPPKLIFIQIGNTDNKVLWDFLKKNIHTAVEILTTTDVSIVELEK
jgi:predicted nuclease of predicted toxin-antitoxin system